MKDKLHRFLSVLNNNFLLISVLVALFLCTAHCWLYWPGYIQDDSRTTFLLVKNGWHPVIMAYLTEMMYFLFSEHIYDLFLLTMIPFYVGLWFIVYSAYLKTKSWMSLLLFFPCFIANIVYAQIRLGSSSFATSWMVLLYAMTLYAILNLHTIKKIKTFLITYVIVFLIALLGRHNAILQVWPVTLVWIGLYLSKKDFSFMKYCTHFISFGFLSGIFCIFLFGIINFALVRSDKGDVYPSTLIVIHQIVGACAPEMDESCFDPQWFNKDWAEDPNRMARLKKKYEQNLIDPEPFVFQNYTNVPFKHHTDLKGRASKWLYAVTKYPKNYFNHILRFYKKVWSLPPDTIPSILLRRTYTKQGFIVHANFWNPTSTREYLERKYLVNLIPDNEFSIKWTKRQQKTDYFIRTTFPAFHSYWFVATNFVMFIIACLLLFKERTNKFYVFFFCTSLGGVVSNILIPFWCPRIFIRYMDPVIFCAVLSIDALFLILYEPAKSAFLRIINHKRTRKIMSFIKEKMTEDIWP